MICIQILWYLNLVVSLYFNKLGILQLWWWVFLGRAYFHQNSLWSTVQLFREVTEESLNSSFLVVFCVCPQRWTNQSALLVNPGHEKNNKLARLQRLQPLLEKVNATLAFHKCVVTQVPIIWDVKRVIRKQSREPLSGLLLGFYWT